MKTFPTIIMILALLTACGSDPTNPDPAAADVSAWADLDPAGSTVLPDEPGADEDTGLDFGDIAEWDIASRPPDLFGEMCLGAEDCAGLPCVDEGYGLVCAAPCIEECPVFYDCRAVGAKRDQMTNVCIGPFVPHCRPCHDTSDCARFAGDDASFCHETDSALGSYCTSACEDTTDCPAGLACDDEVCVAENGECDCQWAPTNLGHSTACVDPAGGLCVGERVCTEDGLTECSATEPTDEICNGVDDNCNGQVDEEVAPKPCAATNTEGTCSGVAFCVAGTPVCDAPQAQFEVCDGLDNDCDGEVDEDDAVDCIAYFVDGDGDGFGSQTIGCACQPGPGAADNSLDCNDHNPAIFLAAPELCDNIDNNCNGQVDEQCDFDGDGYCVQVPLAHGPEMVCRYPQVDCNDLSNNIHPGHLEWCDGLDNDCDQIADEGCDQDGDGYCHAPVLKWGVGLICSSPEVDCDDDDESIHPGADELCDGINQNCNLKVDDGCDGDSDGYCANAPPASVAYCYQGIGKANDPSCTAVDKSCPQGFHDCNDTNYNVHPGAAEICNAMDDDCDTKVDEEFDKDKDGYCAQGAAMTPGCIACLAGAPADCNDTYSAINPGADDLPDLLGVDQNCDGLDGNKERAVFVSSTGGSDTYPGTMEKPKKTIQAAIESAFGSSYKDSVLVATGTYTGSVKLRTGVHLWGGYEAAQGWSVNMTKKSLIAGGPTAVEGFKLISQTSIGRLSITAANAASSGQSSIGLFASESPGLSLTGLEIKAGKGAKGASGADGTKGMNGKNGANATSGCFTSSSPVCYNSGTDNTCPGFAAGAKGMEFTCGGRGDGLGDIPATGPWTPATLATWTGIGEGEPSCCYKKWGKSKGGEAGVYAGSGKDGSHGGDGLDGTYGSHGKGGYSKGNMTKSKWLGDAGNDGDDGGDGCGGGGGGMGKKKNDAFWWCDSKGGGGGGGGAGGTAGKGGKGGKAGGGSIAIVIYKSPISVTACELTAGNGGKGGNGGKAGKGGTGGKGGLAGKGYEGSGKGGFGGLGGDGGDGGVGGGGSGGTSAAVIYDGKNAPTVKATTYALGAPGQGGKGGLTSAGNPVNGTNGLPGKKANKVSVP